jgi:hypothetical protein
MKRHRPLALALILLFCASAVYSQSSPVPTVAAEPQKPEFPQWVRDLRRAEIVAFGAFPFAMFFSIMGMDLYRSATHNWDSQYYPWPFKPPGAIGMDTDQRLMTLGIASAGALVFALADHLIVRSKRARAERQKLDLPEGDLIILRRPWPPEEAPDEGSAGGEAGAPDGAAGDEAGIPDGAAGDEAGSLP